MTVGIVVIGAGAFGREVHDVIEAIDAASAEPVYEFLGFVDGGEIEHRELVEERGPILGDDSVLADLPPGTRYAIAIGSGAVRARLDARAVELGLVAEVLVHPRAMLGTRHIVLGPGTVVCALANLTTNVTTGRHAHINISATIGHDVVLGDCVTISPGVGLSGAVTVGDRTLVGAGASVIQGVAIGADVTVGMGAAVLRDLPDGVTAFGVPARAILDRG